MSGHGDSRTPISELFRYLEASSFSELAGARLSARIPIARALVNRLVAEALKGSTAPIRDVDVQPYNDDRFDVVVTTTWAFVPALRIACAIERQPRFPESPELVLRWSLLGAAGALVSRFVTNLPPGLQLDGARLIVDVAALAASKGHSHLLPLVSRLECHTADGRMVFDVALEVR